MDIKYFSWRWTKKTPFFLQSYTNFFKTKVSYISFDEDSGKEKKINENLLVQADSLKTTYDKIEIRLQGSIFEWEVKSIVKHM